MGSLIGHMLPGTFFILFALWWLISITRNYYRSRISRHAEEYRNQTMYLSKCLPRVPIEGILKILATSIGIAGETVTGFEHGHWAHWGNAQHISMFLFFGFTGVVDVLYFYKFDIPPNLDYASAFLAFSIEGFLFYNHLHGRSHMDVMVHMYLVYAIVGCVVCVAFEARYRENVTIALARTYFTLLQGTWFFQVGFILYPPGSMAHWDLEDHEQMMIVTMIYSWHCALVGVAMFLITILVGKCVKRGTVEDSSIRSGIQYQKVNVNGFDDSTSLRPIISNGGLRQTFEETSEDEV